MRSKLRKWALGALAMSAVAMMSVAPMAVYAEEDVAAEATTTTGSWIITNVDWDDDSIDWTAGTIKATITLTEATYNSTTGTWTLVEDGDSYERPVTAYKDQGLTIAATCTTDEQVSFGFTLEEDSTQGDTSDYYTHDGTALGHDWVQTSTDIIPATCMENGSVTETYTCSRCEAEDVKVTISYATGHSYGEEHVDMDSLDNILVDADGNLVLDDDGNLQAADTSKNASYDMVTTCENVNAEGEVCGAVGSRRTVVIPVSTATATYMYVDVSTGDKVAPWGVHNMEGYFYDETHQEPTNTHFVGSYDNGNAYSAILDVIDGTLSIDDVIRLDDHDKDGSYSVIYYNLVDADGDPYDFGNWNVLRIDTYTISARHYETKVQIDQDNENNSSYLLKNADGDIVAKYENGVVVGAYNTHCTLDATVVLETVCVYEYTDPSTGIVYTCEEVISTETVTIPATGVHQFTKDSETLNTDDPGYEVIDGTYHSYNRIWQCSICGEWFETTDGTDVHHKEMVTENVVNSTCGTSGSYDMVVRCKECGYEFSRVTVTTLPTDKHVYGDYVFTWDGDTFVSYDDLVYDLTNGLVNWDNSRITTTVTVGQICTKCNGEGEVDHEGILLSDEANPYVSVSYVDQYHNTKLGTLVVTVGEPTKTSYACAPAEVVLTATLYDTDGETILAQDTKIVAYYGSVADYEARTAHTPVTKTVVKEDGTYSVTTCYVCGLELSSEKISSTTTPSTDPLAAVTGLKATAGVGSSNVTLTWDAVEGADGYLILAYKNDTYVGQIGYTASTKFVDVNASDEEYNYYWVVAYYKNSAGKVVAGNLCDYVWAIEPLAVVENLAAESTDDGVVLTWNAVDRASYYTVMYGTSGSELTTVTVEGTSFTDTTAVAGEYSSYVVLPMYKTPAGGYVTAASSTSVTILVK